MDTLVSIALCTFNGQKYLQNQLDSILAQTYVNIELIIIDDCSTDSTYSMLESYKKQHPKIQLHRNEKNIGFNTNFYKAISFCIGDYIAIADQDDIWDKNKIEKLVAMIGDNLMIYHDSEYINEEGLSLNISTRSHHRFVKDNCSKKLVYFNCVSGHAALMSRKLIDITPPVPTDFYYDWWFAYTAACVGKIDYVKDKLVRHRIHEESSTKKDKSNSKYTRLAHLTNLFNHKLTPSKNKNLIDRLIRGYTKLNENSFSFKLLVTLLANANILFYVRKKSIFSIIKFSIDESTN